MCCRGYGPFRISFVSPSSVRGLFGGPFDLAPLVVSFRSSPFSSAERFESLGVSSEALSEPKLCAGTFFEGVGSGGVGRDLSFFVLDLSVSRAGRLTPTMLRRHNWLKSPI